MELPAGTARCSRVGQNYIINALPEPDHTRFKELTSTVDLRRGEVLYEPGSGRVRFLYFPQTCVISLIQRFRNGEGVESATIGCEGVVCLPAALGADTPLTQQVVQVGGRARRIELADYRRVFDETTALREGVRRYSIGFAENAMLSVACNRAHSVLQRLARWLLLSHDRNQGDRLTLTHETIGEMLGVHRPTVTHAFRRLREARLIESRQGEITIVDRTGLEAIACECYRLGASVLPARC